MDDGLHSVIQQSVRKNIELDAFSWSSACWGCQYVRALSSKCSCHGLLGENVGSLPPGCDVKWQDNSALWVSTGQWSVSSGKKCWLSNHSPCYCGWAPYKPKYVGTVPSTFQLLTTFPQSLKGFSESVQVLAFWFHPFPSLPHKSRNLLSLRTAWSNMLWNIPWFMDQGIEDKEKLLFFFQCFFFFKCSFSVCDGSGFDNPSLCTRCSPLLSRKLIHWCLWNAAWILCARQPCWLHRFSGLDRRMLETF